MPRGRPPLHSPPRQSDLPELIELWQRAATTARGITIPFKNPPRLAAKLYAARREVGGFSELKVIVIDDAVKIVPRDA